MTIENLVTVVIPTYNREATINEAIESILNQSYKKTEILVCDDFSTDHTVEKVNELIKEHNNIRILSRKDRLKGANAARNLGITEAKGEYIVFLDSDDILIKDSIYNRIKIFEEYPEIDMVYGDCIIGEKVCKFDKIQNFEQKKYLMEELSLCNFSVMMIKKNVFDVCPLLDTRLKSWQDDGLVLELNKYNKKMFHCGCAVDENRISKNSITSNYRNLYEGCKYIVKLYKKDILSEKNVFRFALWKLRILLNWFRSKEQTGKNSIEKWIYEKLFQLLLLVLKPFFRHIWG
jgi:glycosyltransferase involved in cell wall biosynthesis